MIFALKERLAQGIKNLSTKDEEIVSLKRETIKL